MGRRDTRVRHADSFDLFLLNLALAYILLGGLGLEARLDCGHSARCVNRRAQEFGGFTIGRAMLDKLTYSPEDLLRLAR